jgi:hypothetical protein
VFGAVFFVQNKIYLVDGFSVQFAIGGKTKHGVGFCIHLHAWGFIIMERAVYSFVPVGVQPVIIQNL